MSQLFIKDYFLVFTTDQSNYCWRVINKKPFSSLPKMINDIVEQMEEEGKTNVALIKINRI